MNTEIKLINTIKKSGYWYITLSIKFSDLEIILRNILVTNENDKIKIMFPNDTYKNKYFYCNKNLMQKIYEVVKNQLVKNEEKKEVKFSFGERFNK